MERLGGMGIVRTMITMTALVLVFGACGASNAPAPSQPAQPSAADSGSPLPGASAASSPPSAPGTADIAETLTFSELPELSVEGTVTVEDGGVLTATGADGTIFELAVPPYAVDDDTIIKLTPLGDVRGVGPNTAHAVLMEPDGLVFAYWPRLTITPREPIPTANQAVFEAGPDGADVHHALIDPQATDMTIIIRHFSIAGAAYAESVGVWQAQRSLARIDVVAHEAGKMLHEMKVRGLTVAGGDAEAEALRERLLPFFEEADREAAEQMRPAAALSCEAMLLYVRTLVSLERQRFLVYLTTEEWLAANAAEIQRARDSSYANCERQKISECRAKRNAHILVVFWLTWERDRVLAGDGGSTAIPDDFVNRARKICEQFDYRIKKTVAGSFKTTSWSIEYTATKCGGYAGTWNISSGGSLSGGGDTARIGGPIEVTINEETRSGPFTGTAGFVDTDTHEVRQTLGQFGGTATVSPGLTEMVLDVTTGQGSGYSWGFLDTGIFGPGTLTFPLEEGYFCGEPPSD